MLNCLLAQIAFQANCMAATQCIKPCGRDGDDLLKSKESIRIGKKGDLSDFDCGTVVGCKRCVGHKLLIYWDCLTNTSLSRIYQEWSHKEKKKIYHVSSYCVDRNALLMLGVRGKKIG